MKSQFPDDDETLKFVNCAGCGETILGESCLPYWEALNSKKKHLQPIVHARIKGRPYCKPCTRVQNYGKKEGAA